MVSYYNYYYLEEGLKEKLKSMVLASLVAATPLAAKIDPVELYNQIAHNEGVRPVVYKDSTGRRTIGVGFNLEDADNRRILQKHKININELLKGKPLTVEQIKTLYNESLTKAFKDVKVFAPNFDRLPDNVKMVLIDMSFNLGLPKLQQFVKLKDAIRREDFKAAAKEMENSAWAKQVGSRAKRLTSMIRPAS